MRIVDACYLCIKLFKKEFIFYFIMLMVAVFTITTLLSATHLYQQFVAQSFASKQPHFTLVSFDKQWQMTQDRQFIDKLFNTAGVMVVSPFAKSVAWGQFSATTSLSAETKPFTEHDKFSSSYFTVIGIDKRSPAVVSWQNLNFYHAGVYRSKISNLEFSYLWLNKPNLVVPNAVFDASFYPPISQQAFIKSQLSDQLWQVSAYLQDHIDEARLYVGIKQFNEWINKQQVSEQGIYIRMQPDVSLANLQQALNQLCAQRCNVSSWMDEYTRKSKVLTVLKVFSWTTSVTICVLALLLVSLYLAKSIMDKAKTINILQITGYRFNDTLLSIVVSISAAVFMFFLIYLQFMFPWLANWLNSSSIIPSQVLVSAGLLCLLSCLFLMGVFNLAIRKV